ncbi:hypothetical protein ACHWQZ_G018614 [Mnemiopsis leidyi]
MTVVQGRTSLLEIEIENVKYCIVKVYCPNSNETTVVESTFSEALGRSRDDFLILAGDWNTVLNSSIDKAGGGAKSKQLPLDSTTHKHPLIYLIMTNNRRNSGIPHNKTLTGQKKINRKSQPPPPSSPLLNVDVDEPSDTDQLRTSTNNVAEKLIRLSDIELHIQHRTIQEGQFDDRIKTMSSQLTNLQASFTELKETTESSALAFRNSPAPPPKGKIPNSIEAFVEPQMESLISKVEVHAETIENFLDDDTCKAITEFLDCEPFTEETGHSDLLFGHPYSYTGSKALSDSPEIPPVIKPLFDKLNKLQAKAFNERYPDIKSKGPPPVLNSCLVNKYVGPDSFLSEHCDDVCELEKPQLNSHYW